MKPCKGEESMKMDLFEAVEEVYTKAGIGNTLMIESYEHL